MQTYTPFMESLNERARARLRVDRIRTWAVVATVWAVCVSLLLALVVWKWGVR